MSRRCLICSNINPCREHSGDAQDKELRDNTAFFYSKEADEYRARRDAQYEADRKGRVE